MIEQIVGRIHVSCSDFEAIRYVVSRMKQGRRTFLAMKREHRRRILETVAQTHRANRELYRQVMGGL